MVLYNGTTQTTVLLLIPDSEYGGEVKVNLGAYEECVAYWPNQTFI